MTRDALRQYPFLALFALLLSLMYPGQSGGANRSGQAAQTARQKPKAAAKGVNIKTGTLVSIEPDALKISLKTAAGEILSYPLGETSHYYRDKKESEASAFKPGDGVTVKLRKIRKQTALFVFELADSASYAWLTDLRKNPKAAVIKDISEDLLTVTIEGTDAAYTVSAKTRWNRSGKEVTAEAFKAGDKVEIIPRSLPSGNVMARVVADNLTDAERSKAEGAGILNGVFKSLDASAHTLTFLMDGGESRTVPYDANTEIRLRSKAATITALKAGQHITVHVTHTDDGKELAARVTIEQTRRKPAK